MKTKTKMHRICSLMVTTGNRVKQWGFVAVASCYTSPGYQLFDSMKELESLIFCLLLSAPLAHAARSTLI